MAKRTSGLAAVLAAVSAVSLAAAQDAATTSNQAPDYSNRILTPPPPAIPRINGRGVYGQRPGRPFLYTIPATGDRPMTFTADGLPDGLALDDKTGRITGKVDKPGEYAVTLNAKNDQGAASRTLKIVIGDTISLTPAMGWNSWNSWAKDVDQAKVLASAKAMVDSGLIDHGWTYINIDDSWQGKRGGEFNGIQPNEKFPDMKGLADQIHAMGLKIGIYSTPWVTSYAGFVGGSSDNQDGAWSPPANRDRVNGKYSFADNDARQWAAWGIDYLKYDWNPKQNKTPDDVFHQQTETMEKALLHCGRDVVYSYSNSMPFDQIADQSKMLNSWRTTGDIRDTWWSLTSIGFTQDKWAPYASPGHWNDPDMLVVGDVGWSKNLHPSHLTADEQYTHISLWSLLSAPLLIGCPIERADKFTLSLLTNDEVLAVDQDALGKEARLVASQDGEVKLENVRRGRSTQTHSFPKGQVWAKPLQDGSRAVGLFNLGDEPMTVVAKFDEVGVSGKQVVRDLWRQKDVGAFDDKYEAKVEPHGVVLVKMSAAK